ncbi:LuxR C-terminal-related transcriptional regulator [Paenibacillus aurantiacus]|uniref:LuxR C-terminal-related transcriptional regulator n=1 Tax=Paenibacillus aurantiacus TaxID=1936118 RepID=A0ABV5KPF2_9BACL
MNGPTAVLATKLHIPAPRTKIVFRPRLFERLNEGLDRKLTLIAASAGYGKTTLVSEWAAGCQRPLSWLTLDEGDNDFPRFLTHLIAALQRIAEHIGGGVIRAFLSPQPPSTESMLTMLINEISALPHPFVLVLDDYHTIRAKSVEDSITFLLEHAPPQMHLVIATREDPQLPLGRLRARGHLTELRVADLCFTPGEAAEFLNQAMGLGLAASQITMLEGRTEGWIAGLQLAALSMQGRKDIPAFIQAFAGDNRYIVDYLVEEVLHRQSEPMRRFLLQTSILDRLHGPLCDAVTGQEGGSARLHALERGNFFIVALDDARHWYRYHHLFAEVLSAHLKADQPELAAALHRRASAWFEQHGTADEAIRHALAAADFARAADLLELAWPAMRQGKRGAAMLSWLKSIPDELVRRRPVLSAAYAWALLTRGELKAAQDRLLDAERWLALTKDPLARPSAASGEMVIVDEEEFHCLPGTIAGYRAVLAQAQGDIAAAMKYARLTLDLAPADDYLRRGAATALLGLASWTIGDLETAHQTFADGMASVQLAGNVYDAIGGIAALADIRMAQGRLRQTMRTYERGLELAKGQDKLVCQAAADIYAGMSELYREHDELQLAMELLSRSKEMGEGRYRWLIAMARMREAQGDLDGALNLLGEAERVYKGGLFPNVRPLAALKTRVRLAQGNLDEALDWVRERRLSACDDLSYLREFEHITLARVLLARHERDREDGGISEALGLAERLLSAAEEGGRTGSVIEILIVQALARHRRGDASASLAPLRKALTLAEPEGYVRMFADEGRPMAELLETAAKQGIAPSYVRRLLAVFGKAEGHTPVAKPMITEQLSEREREVLRLLETDMSGPDIARRLHVSLNTLRTHTKNIYDKLGVNNRRSAVRLAQELDLI